MSSFFGKLFGSRTPASPNRPANAKPNVKPNNATKKRGVLGRIANGTRKVFGTVGKYTGLSYVGRKLRYVGNMVGTRLGLTSPAFGGNKVAQASFSASEGCKTATTQQTLNALASGVMATLAVSSVTMPALAPAFLGLSVLLAVVIRQRAMNRELKANLTAIQLEADSMFQIMRVVEDIAKENDIDLNTQTVRLWLKKLTDYVTLVAGPEAMQLILARRTQLSGLLDDKSALSQEISAQTATRPPEKKRSWGEYFTSWGSFVNRVLAPGEYLRILIREVVILHIFFSIMMAEFDLFMRAKGDVAHREWTKLPAFQMLLKTNKMLTKVGFNAALKTAKEAHAANVTKAGIPFDEKAFGAKRNVFYDELLLKGAADALSDSKGRVESLQANTEFVEQVKEKTEEAESKVEAEIVEQGGDPAAAASAAGEVLEEVAEETVVQNPVAGSGSSSNGGTGSSGGARTKKTKKSKIKTIRRKLFFRN
jgi:hypothetical protein